MREALKEPNLPPGALVETFDDGSALRNDGLRLTSAAKKPWYILATVAGEHSAKNRRFWNGWMCQNMSADDRKDLAVKLSLPEVELAPLSDGELQQIQARFKTAFPGKSLYNIAPNPGHAVDLKLVNFPHDISFDQFYFSHALFENVHFAGFADFDKAHFAYGANFQETHFSEGAFFPDAVFARGSNFKKAYFSELAEFQEAYFVGHANFQEAHFVDFADFKEANFAMRTDFQKARFNGNASFEKAHFNEAAHFQEVHFAGETNFQEADFADFANFQKVYFSGDTVFQKTHFNKQGVVFTDALFYAESTFFIESYFAGPALFNCAQFAGLVLFQKSNFDEEVFFQNASFNSYADFSDGTFKACTSFDGATFKTQVPKLYQREIHQDTTFSDNPKHWPKVTSENAEEGKQAYTRLRQIAADNHNPDLEHFFLRQEMRCKEMLAKYFDKIIFIAYRGLASSGISVARPAGILTFIWLVSGFFFHYAAKKVGDNSDLSMLADLSLLGSFGLSFANLMAFLGFNRLYFKEVIDEFGPWLSLLAGAQTVAGVVLLFFIGLGLRNRFRLK
ncbi:pentapeptide repeat-containing protein [Halomonas janggokensis]|uniref:Pentapeptide repeat-containing protein n=1 Tax=Vreelandella janggokensis TaxID=370767 RepID=A0ABT4IY65_9GAMM|nr:pentapeptide repeat-containing protein [Halomonas janggokensis]MCZ0928614.1 pentapeptide repeat-containing protein [Halomonas janggokensis]MCZ0931349.1 pentapeptide repeat-containing protein [Halomonas janggokensis]